MFSFNFDKRTMYIIIGIMLLFILIQYATNPGQLLGLLISAPGVLIAITFHEFAHGYAAYKLGDDTAKRQGRLSLNPFAHLDPIGTLMLLVAGFGWGKPVEVDPRNYTRKISMEKGEAIVSLGLNYVKTMRFIIVPQAIKNILPALGNEMITLLKDTSLVTVIGLKDMVKGALIIQGRTYQAFMPLVVVAIIYLVLVIILSKILSMFERRMRESDRR